MIDECFPVRKCYPSIPRGPLRLMSRCQEPPSLCLAVSSHSVLINCLQSPRAKKKKQNKTKNLVYKKLPLNSDLKNQCPDVIINLGSYYQFSLILCILYLTVFVVVVVVVMYKSPQIWCSSRQDINSE